VDVSVWRADIERQMHRVVDQPGWVTKIVCSCGEQFTTKAESDRHCIPSPVYIVGEGRTDSEIFDAPDGQPGIRLTDHPPVGWPSPNETSVCSTCLTYYAGCSACGGSGVTAGTRTELRVQGEAGKWPQCDYPNGVLWATATWQTLPGDTPGTFKAVLTDIEMA